MQVLEHTTKKTNNNIETIKPPVEKTFTTLSGYIANSMNGGHIKPIFYQRVFAGQQIDKLRLRANFKLQTPLSPNFQKLSVNLRCYFVPHSRVWTNYEKYVAKQPNVVEPCLDGVNAPLYNIYTPTETGAKQIYITNTDIWRDSFISSYYPRIGEEELSTLGARRTNLRFPRISALPLRGFKAIYNDYERDKRYDAPLTEMFEDNVSKAEFDTYLPYATSTENPENPRYHLAKLSKTILRARRNNEYYTDYRTDLVGYVPTGEQEIVQNQNPIINFNQAQKHIADARAVAENVQKTDYDIISELYGSERLTEKRVNYLGYLNIPINYTPVNQTSYNTNDNVDINYQSLGTQGAVAYTEVDEILPIALTFKESGFIHILATLTVDSIYETGLDRANLLNISLIDQYRPDNKEIIDDVLYALESDCTNEIDFSPTSTKEVRGFKRKYTEYFKLANQINGDLTTLPIMETSLDMESSANDFYKLENELLTDQSYQFFEISDRTGYEDNVNPSSTNPNGTKQLINKHWWQDYSDLILNRKQAIKNNIEYYAHPNVDAPDGTSQRYFARVKGKNQLYFLGVVTCDTILPMDNKIEDNVQNWGEN